MSDKEKISKTLNEITVNINIDNEVEINILEKTLKEKENEINDFFKNITKES